MCCSGVDLRINILHTPTCVLYTYASHTVRKNATRAKGMRCTCRGKNNVRTTVNFRANDGKDRSNDYTSGHYDRPGEYSALNRLIIYVIVRCPYGASAAIDRSIVRTCIRTCVHIYIYIYIHRRSMRRRT